MKVLFLDDSFRADENYLGHGGFCIDESQIRTLAEDILSLKRDFGIPRWVVLKWSPHRNHFLRTEFKGDRRQELNKEAINLLHKRNTTVLCAVHDLNDCYGVRRYNWNFKRIRLWATKEQFKFIAERFEKPYLSSSSDGGLVIADRYSDTRSETSLIREATLDFERGTEFRKFQKLCIPPLTAAPRYCSPLQIADIIVGVIVASLAKGGYGLELFEDVAKLFLRDPHEGAKSFVSSLSSSILGFGLKLFPPSFRTKGIELFQELDQKYIYTSEGLKLKSHE